MFYRLMSFCHRPVLFFSLLVIHNPARNHVMDVRGFCFASLRIPLGWFIMATDWFSAILAFLDAETTYLLLLMSDIVLSACIGFLRFLVILYTDMLHVRCFLYVDKEGPITTLGKTMTPVFCVTWLFGSIWEGKGEKGKIK